MKRNVLVTSILVLFLIPAFALAADADMFVAKVGPVESGKVIVPLEVANSHELVAMDIPLSFSEGAILEEVRFTERVEYFDVKIANIDNEKNQVLIGLISMVYQEQPDLAPGSGPIAELVFSVDEGVDKITIESITLENPDHALTAYWNDFSSGRPEVQSVSHELKIDVDVTGQVTPKTFALFQNSPNPFNPTTRISYDLPKAGNVNVAVFNVLGQRVTDLVDSYQEAGSYEVVWNGKDDAGRSVASGVYFYRIESSDFADTKKMLLLK
jgi:hypothetical protein